MRLVLSFSLVNNVDVSSPARFSKPCRFIILFETYYLYLQGFENLAGKRITIKTIGCVKLDKKTYYANLVYFI